MEINLLILQEYGCKTFELIDIIAQSSISNK